MGTDTGGQPAAALQSPKVNVHAQCKCKAGSASENEAASGIADTSCSTCQTDSAEDAEGGVCKACNH